MAYARIPLDFQTMMMAYRDHNSNPDDIKAWLKNQHEAEAKENAKRKEWNEAHPNEKPKGMLHSTTCCMQASLSFNATADTIPKEGSRDRQNTTLDRGMNYILSVQEFRNYLTYKYGPTDQLTDTATIKGKKGVITYGNAHIEFWDGNNIFQSTEGAKARAKAGAKVDTGATMGAAILQTQPQFFWEIGTDDPAKSGGVPAWAYGWWHVYDGNNYYYFFSHDRVCHIKTKPNIKWTPPSTVGNWGTVEPMEHGLKITWNPLEKGGVGTIEEFTQLNWTSTEKMNGECKNKGYSPLFATKMETSGT